MSPHAAKKNGPGRPRKAWQRNGAGIKLSAAVERSTVDAGCRLYDMGLQLPRGLHTAARLHARKRAHMHQALRRKVVKAVQRPAAQHHMQQMSWLRSHVSSTEASKNVKAKRPLVLSRTLFHEGRLSKESESLVRLWVSFWALAHVRTTFSTARGFGLEAAVKRPAGVVVAYGLLEKDYDEPCYTVLGGGTMYGPAAFVNAACSNACANAVFRVQKGVWRVETKRVIQPGEEVLVHYPARGLCKCGATEWA